MRLKRLEMVGFKSFADKTRVEFEAGITAVVGPNGCGKSNISDAVRWSLGEMSAKSLRSQQMLDVVFNGTANRPAQGMSEVSLTFDNTSHRIPLDYTEVTVTRRLFRSGESEYYINKTQCRLKDLRDLFLDTGVGNDGYYVMAQGKIEFILSSKPEERRELFEEAAGVSKYKARREEALRRLSKVEQDMLRLNDSLAIYKQQIDTLEAAVRKAKTHQRLQEELRALEISLLVNGMIAAGSQREQLQAQSIDATQKVSDLQAQLRAGEEQVSGERTKASAIEERVLEMQRQVAALDSDIARTEAEQTAAQERVADLQNQQVRLEAELKTLTATAQENQDKHLILSQEIDEVRKIFEAKDQTFQTANAAFQAQQAALTGLQREAETSKGRLLELARLISHHRNETVRLTSLSIRHEEASKAKVRELEKVQLRRTVLDEQLQQHHLHTQDTTLRLTTVDDTLARLQKQQADDTEKLSDMDQTIQSVRERIARLEAERISLERWLSQDPVALAAVALQTQNLPGIHGPVASLLKTTAPFQRLLDRALGDRSNYFVADTLNDAQAAVRFLSDERKGWATFLILERLQHVESQTLWDQQADSRSLSQAIECEERLRPVVNYLVGKTFYVGATLFEETMLRGGADPLDEGFQATPSDLARLTQELAQLAETLQLTNAAKEDLKKAMAERELERVPLQGEQRKLQVLSQVQQENHARLTEDKRLNETEIGITEREKNEILAAIESAQKALANEEILLTNLESEDAMLQETYHNQDADLQQKRQDLQTKQAEVSQLRLDAETNRERLQGKQREIEQILRQIMTSRQRLEADRQQQSANAQRILELGQQHIEKTAHLTEIQTLRGTHYESLTAQLAERAALQGGVDQAEKQVSITRELLTQAQAVSHETEFRLKALQTEMERLEQTLTGNFALSLEDAKIQAGEVQTNSDEISRLRRRLDSLGAVNLAAPEEHAQLQERYVFLQTQQADLLKAKDDLHQAIGKINATTRETFRTTFDQVRQNFRQLYQTLFQGGEADLILTDEQNLLDTGVEIVAQPPGKKLQNIALLSGGEKALTAIALLFAFFMVKPSPFCLLDEVDAPLDEANVGRFLRMVKSFSEKTQFIVITHNKRTMEMADVLYGVTMAELGVSSLISVKLESRTPSETAAV